MTTIETLLNTDQRAVIALIAAATRASGTQAYLVGGAVRDWLLRAPAVDDLDIAVEGDAGAFALALAAQHGGEIERHARFNTARWTCRGVTVDLAMSRAERYARPAALPDVEPAPLATDLLRRDFSINAIALRLSDGALIDPLGGTADLERRQLRALHARSFVDDPTRILRAARYASRLGFDIEARTLGWIGSGLTSLRQLSGERVKYDLELCFQDADPARALGLLDAWGVFKALGIPVPAPGVLAQRYARLTQVLGSNALAVETLPLNVPAVDALRALGWGALTYNIGQLPATRWLELLPLEVPVRDALSEQGVLSSLSPKLFMSAISVQSDTLKPFGPLALLFGHLYDSHVLKQRACICELRDWRWVRPATTGDDLKRMGVPPGPRFKTLLDALRAAWLDGAVKSLAQEQTLLQALLAQDRA